MAFKMKSGSPMKRNFGSPAKQKSPMEDKMSASMVGKDVAKAHNADYAKNPKHNENMHKEGRNTSIAEKERKGKEDSVVKSSLDGERKEKVEWKETSREKISPTSSAGKKGATHKVTLTSPTGGTKVVYS